MVGTVVAHLQKATGPGYWACIPPRGETMLYFVCFARVRMLYHRPWARRAILSSVSEDTASSQAGMPRLVF
jgi:hypothetical protein